MTKSKWILKIDGVKDNIGIFKTREEGIDAALKLVSKKFANISEIIDEVLKYRHTKACKSIIEKFKDVENLRSVDIYEVFGEEDSIEEDSFAAERIFGETVIFSISFGKTPDDLYIETNIWDEDAQNYFLYVRSKNGCIKYSIDKKMTLPTVANIFLVYKALTTIPQLRREIRDEIFSKYDYAGYEIKLAEDTISNQIHTLQELGIPIYERSLSSWDKKNQAALMEIYGDEYKDGYYLDYDRPITPDYSIKPGSYIMLVYLTLKEIDKDHAISTQQGIVDAVHNKFGVTLQRQKVKKYLDLLIELDSGINHDQFGYWMK